jgi:transposase
MVIKKTKYTPEFKAEAAKLVTEQGYSQAEAARSLGVRYGNMNRWISELGEKSAPRKEKPMLSAEQKELEQLRKENKRLKLEREILKKAAAFFANEPN